MNFPFNAFTELGVDVNLLLSLLIGIGFGFMLEKGGFGSSKVLAGIFYGKDWRVLKVMFTAIVTAMLGLYAADGLGLVHMDLIDFRPTYLGGQIVGGLLLGIGFVTAGYCPGTSMVGLVSGKLDAAVVMLGILLGIGVFEEGFTFFASLRDWGEMGRVSLADWMGISTGWVVLMVVAMAVAAFTAVGWGERHYANKAIQLPRKAMAAMSTAAFGGLLVAFIQFAGPGSARAMNSLDASAIDLPSNSAVLSAEELAGWIVEGRSDYFLVDLRGPDSDDIVPGAWKTQPEVLLNARTRPEMPQDRPVILIANGDPTAAALVRSVLRELQVNALVLQGGTSMWQQIILDPNSTSSVGKVYRMMMSGNSPLAEGAPPPPPRKKNAAPPAKKKSRGGGCS
jgi:uncharacterized protein